MKWGHNLCLETISNNLRYKIIMLLKKKSMNVSKISSGLNVERSNISHALELLKKCRLVNAKKQGKQMIYTLNNTLVMQKKKGESLFKIIENHKKEFCEKCHKIR